MSPKNHSEDSPLEVGKSDLYQSIRRATLQVALPRRHPGLMGGLV